MRALATFLCFTLLALAMGYTLPPSARGLDRLKKIATSDFDGLALLEDISDTIHSGMSKGNWAEQSAMQLEPSPVQSIDMDKRMLSIAGSKLLRHFKSSPKDLSNVLDVSIKKASRD